MKYYYHILKRKLNTHSKKHSWHKDLSTFSILRRFHCHKMYLNSSIREAKFYYYLLHKLSNYFIDSRIENNFSDIFDSLFLSFIISKILFYTGNHYLYPWLLKSIKYNLRVHFYRFYSTRYHTVNRINLFNLHNSLLYIYKATLYLKYGYIQIYIL